MKYVTTIERMAEARGEARQKEVIALNCLRENIPLETIARWTGLTIEQVQKLQDEQE
jgi:hypothetical protein